MQLTPRKTKFNKPHKPQLKKVIETRSIFSIYGCYSIKIVEEGSSFKITEKQLLACINILRKLLKGRGKFWVLCKASSMLTSKSNESRMGKGKGKFDSWISINSSGKVLFEVSLNKKRNISLIRLIEKRVNERLPFKVSVFQVKT